MKCTTEQDLINLETKLILKENLKEKGIELTEKELDNIAYNIEENRQYTKKEVRQAKARANGIKNSKAYYEHEESIKDIRKYQKDNNYGYFYYLLYNRLLPLGIKESYTGRYLYICTLSDFKGNIIIGKGNDSIKRKDLKYLFPTMNRKQIKETIDNLIMYDLLREENNIITVNMDFILRGKGEKIKMLKEGSIKIYDNAIKEIFNNMKPSEHKYIGYLTKLLPYVNFKYNMLVTNTEERNKGLLQPLNLKEVCDIVGYDRKNSNKLKNNLRKIKVNGQYAVAIVGIGDNNLIAINPRIYYKGTNKKDIEYLEMLFDISENTKNKKS